MYLLFIGAGQNDFDVGYIHFEGHWKGWALKIETFWALKWPRAKRVPFGPKKVEIFRAHPFQWPE